MVLRRSYVTRGLHFALLLIVLHQLFTSLVMERPLPGDDPEWPFVSHQWLGAAGFAVAFLFWAWTLIRDPREPRPGALLPWLSRGRLTAVVNDAFDILRAVVSRRPPRGDHQALASAVHGLGLLTASFLAVSGTVWWLVFEGTTRGRPVLAAHAFAGNLMWGYVLAHAGMAALRQVLGDDIFARMFWSTARVAPSARRRVAHAR